MIEYFCVALISFLAGYFFARLDFFYVALRRLHGDNFIVDAPGAHSTSFIERTTSRAKQADTQEKLSKISIDTSTVVTKIDTDGIQRGSDVELGKTTSQEDTINASVSKLAQLKGK